MCVCVCVCVCVGRWMGVTSCSVHKEWYSPVTLQPPATAAHTHTHTQSNEVVTKCNCSIDLSMVFCKVQYSVELCGSYNRISSTKIYNGPIQKIRNR